MRRRKIVVFTGAGISAESGLKTFRDTDGLWEEYNIMDVATPEAWERDQNMVIEFYNKRREQIINAQPNAGHKAIAELESRFDVQIITQNIDDLHERAGSSSVLHLHGEITKSRSSVDPDLIYTMKPEGIRKGELCEKGSQIRPHIVWFGEEVPLMDEAYQIASEAEIMIIVGTSLKVHPAASVIHYAKFECKKFLIDPNEVGVPDIDNLHFIKEKASLGTPKLAQQLLNI